MRERLGSLPRGPSSHPGAASANALATLSRLLDVARVESRVDTLAIADESGLLVAGAGSWAACEELAALAPLQVGIQAANDTAPSRLDVLTRRTEVRRLTVNGFSVLLCGDGENVASALEGAAWVCHEVLGRR